MRKQPRMHGPRGGRGLAPGCPCDCSVQAARPAFQGPLWGGVGSWEGWKDWRTLLQGARGGEPSLLLAGVDW